MSLLFDGGLRELPDWRDLFSSIWTEMYAEGNAGVMGPRQFGNEV